MSKVFIPKQTVVTGALAFELTYATSFVCTRIGVNFNLAPAAAGSVIFTHVRVKDGVTYTSEIRAVDAVGKLDVIMEGLSGFSNNDILKVEYLNTDARTVKVLATLEV